MSRVEAVLVALAFALAFTVTSGALGSESARAHFSTSGKYSHSTDACTSSTNRVDPVMNVFYDEAYAPNAVGNHIQHHTGWSNQSGSSQWYKTHANPTRCGKNASESQRASACGNCDRTHIRFKQTYHGDSTWGITALGTPHEEVWVSCGHAVTYPYGFQNGRTRIYNNMVYSGGHRFAGSKNWGNTATMKQCNNYWVGSLDGKVDYIGIP